MDASFKTRLKERKPLIGTLLSLPLPETAEICADAGFDWLFIDLEHGLLDIKDAQRIVQTAGRRCPCVVRVAVNEPNAIAKALDTGAAGLIFPHINTAAEARSAVKAAKYPPQGIRSIGVARAQGYGRGVQRSVENDNENTVLIAQAEHIDAVHNIEEILSVPGVDAVFIGPFDLSASMNKPGKISDAGVQDAIGRIRNAGAGRNVPVGIFTGDPKKAGDFRAAGYTLICVGTDAMLFAGVLHQVVNDIKS